MNKNIKNLDNLLEELIKETQPVERPVSMADFSSVIEKPFSLDQAIDKYFIQYERESIPSSEVFESYNINRLVSFLFEQAQDDDAGEDDLDLGSGGDAGGDAGGLDLGGDSEMDLDSNDDEDSSADNDTSQEPVINTPKINLQDFTRSVARLVNNIGSLIDLNTIILNRAEKYITSNYNEKTGREMLEILETTYDLRPVSNTEHKEAGTEFPEPTTGVTGPVGG